MKKTVFLFLLTIIFLTNMGSEVKGSEVIYELDNAKIIITRIIEEGNIGFTVEKTGVSPFLATIIDEDEHYMIHGVKRIEDYFILFGDGYTSNTDTEYNSLFFVLDLNGNIIKKEVRDYGNMESIKDVYYIDNVLITYTESVDDLGFFYLFDSNYFTSYDLDFNYIDSISINTSIKRLDLNDLYIMIGFGSDEYDIGIKSDLSLILKDDFLDIIEGETFIGQAEFQFINGATLNDEYYENGITITYPGDYTLNYNNKIYNFTVKPVITGVIDNEIYVDSVSPTFSGGNILLNNDIYISNTEISKAGNYEFTINGARNYSDTLSFTITSNMEGIVNNNEYTEPVIISFNGDGYLNNKFIESPYEVSEYGEYILKIRGENNYLESYFFTIEDNVNKRSFIDFVQRVDILVLVVVLISGGIILKKK